MSHKYTERNIEIENKNTQEERKRIKLEKL